MHIYLPVAVFAVISMVYCEAFSAMDNKISTRRASLSSITTTATATTARTIISTDVTLNFRRQQRISTLISAMTTSDENDTITTTTTTTTSLIKAEEEEEEEDTKNENEEKSNIPFDEVAWMAYETMMTKIAMQTRRVKNFNEESVSKCRTYLLSREQYIPSVPDVIENEKSILQSSIRNQAESFRQRFNFTSDEFDFVTRSFVKLGDMSAKNQSKNRNNKNNNVNIDNDNEIDHRLPVAVAWYKLKEMGSIPQENSMSTYMYILSSSNSSSNNNNDDDDRSDDDNDDEIAVAIVDDALLEVVTCHDVLYKKNEKTLTIRMKSLVGRGRIDEAEEIFAASFESSSSSSSSSTSEEEESKNEISKERDNKNNNNQVGRLRTYMPLMEHYCRVGDLTSILRLYRKMQDSTGVHWDVESYTILLSSLARFGYFFTDNDNQQKNDDNEEYGSNLFDTLVSNMASDILELTEATFLDLTESFRIGHRDHLNLTSIDNNNNNENENESSAMEIVVDRVEIPTQNGTCPTTGVKLRLLSLDDTQRQHVHDTLLEMARTSTEIFIDMNIEREARNLERQARQRKPTRNNKNKAVKSNSNKGETVTGHIFGDVENKEINKEAYGYQELLRFSKWLDDREGDMFTTIVDGANVGYYGRSQVHYSSIQRLIEKLESMGERPLVVMPEKYTQSSFQASNFHQKLTEKDLEVIERLREKDIMYTVPRLVLDDYFWMLASVSNQTNATQRGDLNIPIGDDQGRFPGMRPMLVTNDKMRDHKLDLLEPREFRRWCSCHVVNYDISFFEDDEWEEDRNISFVPADSFSCEIQVNAHERGKGNVWHFPIEGSTDWLCIWIKR